MDVWTILLIAFGGALAIEGAVWAIVPSVIRKSYTEMFAMGDAALHRAGLFSVAIGSAMIFWAVKSFGN